MLTVYVTIKVVEAKYLPIYSVYVHTLSQFHSCILEKFKYKCEFWSFYSAIECVSSRTFHLRFRPSRGLHYHLPVLFDYFHLAAASMTIHAVLTSLHQPYIK